VPSLLRVRSEHGSGFEPGPYGYELQSHSAVCKGNGSGSRRDDAGVGTASPPKAPVAFGSALSSFTDNPLPCAAGARSKMHARASVSELPQSRQTDQQYRVPRSQERVGVGQSGDVEATRDQGLRHSIGMLCAQPSASASCFISRSESRATVRGDHIDCDLAAAPCALLDRRGDGWRQHRPQRPIVGATDRRPNIHRHLCEQCDAHDTRPEQDAWRPGQDRLRRSPGGFLLVQAPGPDPADGLTTVPGSSKRG
jgi:hypothetical protein